MSLFVGEQRTHRVGSTCATVFKAETLQRPAARRLPIIVFLPRFRIYPLPGGAWSLLHGMACREMDNAAEF